MTNLAKKQSDYAMSVLQQTGFSGDMSAFKKSSDKARSELEGSAGWHNSNDIETLKGLQGRFLWTESMFQPATMEFIFNAGQEGSEGQYTIRDLDGKTVEEGTFTSVPNNPAVGWAFVALSPSSKMGNRSFTVAGMMTDASWEIQILMLSKVNGSGPVNPAFSCVRT